MDASTTVPTLEPAADVARVVAELRSRHRLERVPPLPSFAAILEDISDVAATVVLAEVVSAGPAGVVQPRAGARVDDGRWLAAHVGEQLASLDRFLSRRLADPFAPPSALPDAATFHRLEAPDAALRYRQRLLTILRTMRREASRIRAELAADLRALGAGAAYLERLDSALRRAVSPSIDMRDTRLAELFEAAVLDGLRRAPGPARALVDRWHESGWVARLIADLGRVARAVAAEERALIHHLVQAALDASALAQSALELPALPPPALEAPDEEDDPRGQADDASVAPNDSEGVAA